MIRQPFIVTLFLAATCHAIEPRVLTHTLSPDKQVAIMRERAEAGDLDYYFVQQSGGKKLGFVLPPETRHELSNVSFVTSWNRSSSKVATLLFYGTKLSGLLLHSKDSTGQFQPVELDEPDAVDLYQKRTRKKLPEGGSGASENAVGPWLDDITVRLVTGGTRPVNQSGDNVHVYVTFVARIQNGQATLTDVHLKGPLSDRASARFIKKWGRRYFEAHDE